MKKEKMIKSFESILKYDIYSKYNNVLDKKFKDQSLKAFIYSLKNKKYKEKVPFLDEFYKKYPYDFEKKNITEGNKAIFFNDDESIKIDEKEIKNKLNNNIKNNNNQLRFCFSTKRYEDYPDPFKYNPNYNSIYKKVPSFKISPRRNEMQSAKKDKGKKDLVIDSKINRISNNLVLYDANMSEEEKKIFHNKMKKINNSLDEKNKNNTDNNRKSIKNDKNLNLPLITTTNMINSFRNKNKNNTIDTYNFRDNHTLRFSKYLPRKNYINCSNNEISYLDPHDYKLDDKKALDFGKMRSRDNKGIINTAELEAPPVGKYYPKYSLVENFAKNIIFSPFGLNRNSKKNILKKMLGSYKVFSEYQTIDNEKLFNDNDIINKQLIMKYMINP